MSFVVFSVSSRASLEQRITQETHGITRTGHNEACQLFTSKHRVPFESLGTSAGSGHDPYRGRKPATRRTSYGGVRRLADLDPQEATATGQHRHVAVGVQEPCGETGPFQHIRHLPPMVQALPVQLRRPSVQLPVPAEGDDPAVQHPPAGRHFDQDGPAVPLGEALCGQGPVSGPATSKISRPPGRRAPCSRPRNAPRPSSTRGSKA